MNIFDIFSGPKTIVDHVNHLPKGGLTVMALRALDFAVPGDWDNPTDFDKLVTQVTGEKDAAFVASVHKRCVELWVDKKLGYQGGHGLYHLVDDTDKLVALAVAVERIDLLHFLSGLTPKPEKSQAIDLALKLVAELIAFTKINGIPGDGLGDFVKALADYAGPARLRMAALLAYDGIVPLGPNFVEKTMDVLSGSGAGGFQESKLFQRLAGFIPGGSQAHKLGFIRKGVEGVGGWMTGFAKARGLDQGVILGHLGKFIQNADNKVDYIGAILDASTNYMEHTGTQSVARSMIERAAAEV